ncbi:unnamed protein product [Spirodela intermedia]|uniref:Complex 1 LYR protein domain-containing protein n=1 Tax=Spirodela intermedia TaxID=51605 RepID=A0A7I8J1G2_SPIIN|nr:unnamed protein product [Spirodela intermedia]CAA6663643.1 unnamed protein product [Spirodela intermedia]
MKGFGEKNAFHPDSIAPELANNVIRLYRECLRRARFIGHQQHNTELIVSMVRQQFKKHKDETDPRRSRSSRTNPLESIFISYSRFPISHLQRCQGLINHILYETEKMTGRKFSGGS